MLLQDPLFQRILIVSFYQSLIIIYRSFFAYKLIRRSSGPRIFTLSTFFILSALGYVFPLFSLIFINTNLAYIFYTLTWVVGIYSHSFLIIFSWELARISEPIKFKHIVLLSIPYAIMLLLIIWFGVFLGGIQYNAETGWVPKFTWNFAIFSWISFALFMIFPHSILSLKILKEFEGTAMRKRTMMYIFSVLLEFSIIMLVILYNAWTDNTIFRIIYFVVTGPSSFIAAYYVYKAFVQGLK